MKRRSGFTLLEVLLAMSILSIMGLMVFGSFRSLVDTTTRAENALDKLHLSDTLMNQIEDSLRAAVFSADHPEIYSFLYEKGTGNPQDDTFSWVTSSTAFLPADTPALTGLNRIELSIQDVDGETGLAVRAFSSLLDPESNEAEDVEPWLISDQVTGMHLNFYDPSEQTWEEEWERTNQLPTTLALTLSFASEDPIEPDLVRVRRIDIPVGKLSRDSRRGRRPQTEEAR
ncbi:type II secretion system protein [Kiritimatiellota bacterium B12222]|nr:type II secretion system protein [Kiritimatiellota bacterium B12222]